MSGAGFTPAGLSPAGLGGIDLSAEARDPYTRRINPRTGDWEHGLAPMPLTVEKVLIALGNAVGSFAWDPTKGDPSLTIGKDSGKLLEEVTAYTRAQLAAMVAAGEVEILSIEVATAPGAYSRVVTFRDLATGEVLTA